MEGVEVICIYMYVHMCSLSGILVLFIEEQRTHTFTLFSIEDRKWLSFGVQLLAYSLRTMALSMVSFVVHHTLKAQL